jgi:hypothetical protein
MRELDELLGRKLPDVADGNFSKRVMRHIAWERLRRHAATVLLLAFCLLPVVYFLPLHEIGAVLGTRLPQIAGSLAVQLAAAAVVLTVIAERAYSRL